MASIKNKARTFNKMKYHQVQRKNSRNRKLLAKEQQRFLKDNGYRNLGWENVINLFNQIQDIQQTESIKNLSLEELFIEADRIGNKYCDSKENNRRNLKISQELNEIADIIDAQFADRTAEVIDYSQTAK